MQSSPINPSPSEVIETLTRGLRAASLDGKRVLVLIPDNTRTCPMPFLFRELVTILETHVARLDFLIALGTHQPMSGAAINTMLGVTADERRGRYAKIGVFNHRWDKPETFTNLGTIPRERIREITSGLMDCDVPIGVNKLILDYDQIVILGPTYPHEVVGFSGGLKYFFPGICSFDFIDFFHWLGAMITCFSIIGTKKTPVRDVIDEAAKLLPRPVLNINLVVDDGKLAGVFIGEPREAWSHAADLSSQRHVIYKDKPYKTVLGICPEMYDELWTGGKVMYKLEPIVADGGELIIYAPHIKEVSLTHGKLIARIGYHVRDYFASRMDEFADIPRGVIAHSTHVRGLGTFAGGVEKPRITVTLATSIPRDETERLNLNYRDWKTIDVAAMRKLDDTLVVDHAGEVLHKLK
ncbi:MAG: lactate racemase domain-containing protein [Thermoguttaceae bacterium]